MFWLIPKSLDEELDKELEEEIKRPSILERIDAQEKLDKISAVLIKFFRELDDETKDKIIKGAFTNPPENKP